MRTTTIKPGTRLSYEHPGELEGTPQQVAQRAAGDLAQAAAVFARHVEATARQVRSGFLSDELSRDPSMTPEQLSAAWSRSETARNCLALLRSAKAANTAVKAVQSGQKAS